MEGSRLQHLTLQEEGVQARRMSVPEENTPQVKASLLGECHLISALKDRER